MSAEANRVKGITGANPSQNRRTTQSSIPAFGLSALFLGSAFAPPNLTARTFTPPFVLRVGFSVAFAGAGYMLWAGDSRNGSGVATSWPLSYLVVEQFALGLEKTARRPRSPLAWTLFGASAATAVFYGTEHFIFSEDDE